MSSLIEGTAWCQGYLDQHICSDSSSFKFTNLYDLSKDGVMHTSAALTAMLLPCGATSSKPFISA